MGNLKLRKLIERDTIYKDSHKKFRHKCKYKVHCILKVFNIDGKSTYYDVLKCDECLSFKAIAQKGNVCGYIFSSLSQEQKNLPLITANFNYRNMFISFSELKDVTIISQEK